MTLKSFNQFLSERVVNALDNKTKEQYADEVWDILQKAYAPIGGIHGNGFKSKEDMIQNIGFWKLVKRGDHITAVEMYKQKDGRKLVALGTDGTQPGKKDLQMMMKADIDTGRSYAELSGPALMFLTKTIGGESEMKKYFVPFDSVKKILWDDEVEDVDGFVYRRKIGGSWHEKVMVGNASLSKFV